MTLYLFVYGTLRKGADNKLAAMLCRCARYIGPARVQGRLYRVAHYPGLVRSLDCGDEFVRGDVYAIDRPAAMFRILDAYDGRTAPREFKRAITPVLLDSSERIEAWVYEYTRMIKGLPRIASGDFLNPRRRRF